MTPYVYKNHKLIKRSDCFISIDDRSFRFGDGCFETIPVYHSKAIYLKEHLERLKKQLAELKIELDLTSIEDEIEIIIQKNKLKEAILRIICSRGSGSIGFLPSETCEAYYLIDSQTAQPKLPKEIKLWVTNFEAIRNSQFARIGKSNNSLNNILARLEAQENNCFEAIYRDSEARFLECSSSNFALVRKNKLIFPSTNDAKMTGLTETFLKSIYPYSEQDISEETLCSSERMYILNSAWGIVPVHSIQNLGKLFNLLSKDEIITHFWKKIRATHV